MQPTVVISLEIELAWGLNHLPGSQGLNRHSDDREAETETLERLLELCDDLQIPLTFDVVGHLLLEECSGDHAGPHPGTWFESDPGTDFRKDPLYYAPDLLKKVRDAKAAHEICTHTFSHLFAPDADGRTIDWELDTVRRTHESFGVDTPRSLVPPMHAPYPSDRLKAHGIRGVRTPVEYRQPVAAPTPPDTVHEYIPWRLQRLYPVEVLARSHPVRDPELVDGLVEHYTSWHASLTAPYLPNGQTDPHRLFQLLPCSLRQRIHGRYLRDGLDRAIAENSCAHYWSHLFNLSNDAQWKPVESFLREIARRQENGTISISTMASLTNRVRGIHV